MVIAGIVIGVLVVVGGAVGLGIFLFMKSKKTNKTFKVSKVDGIVAAKAADWFIYLSFIIFVNDYGGA